jgi:hypothetical protein
VVAQGALNNKANRSGLMANQLGKRYQCEQCGTEVLCNKPGNGTVECCDSQMKLKEPKPLPSSD